MPCNRVDLGGGYSAIVCSGRPRAKPCAYCRKPSTRLCDAPQEAPRTGTCDRPMCDGCTFREEPERDLCRQHRPASVTERPAMRMPFGKYGPKHYPPDGMEIEKVPSDYLRWCLAEWDWNRHRTVLQEIRAQLELRQGDATR